MNLSPVLSTLPENKIEEVKKLSITLDVIGYIIVLSVLIPIFYVVFTMPLDWEIPQ